MPPGTDLLQKEKGSKARKKVRAARSALQRQSRKGTLLERSAHAKLRPALVPRRNRNSRKDTRSASGEREAEEKIRGSIVESRLAVSAAVEEAPFPSPRSQVSNSQNHSLAAGRIPQLHAQRQSSC